MNARAKRNRPLLDESQVIGRFLCFTACILLIFHKNAVPLHRKTKGGAGQARPATKTSQHTHIEISLSKGKSVRSNILPIYGLFYKDNN